MSSTLRELVTSFGFDIDDKPLTEMEHAIDRAKITMVALGAAAVTAAGTLFGFAKHSADYGEEALKASKKLGITTESYSKLSTAAYLADVSTEAFANSMKFLNRAMGEAQSGNKDMRKSLSELGVKGTEPVDQAFRTIIGNFGKIKGSAKQTKIALDIFGRGAFDMIPMLKAGNKELENQIAIAEKYRLVVGVDQAEAANAFNDALKESLLAIKGVSIAIGNELIPIVKPVIEEFSKFIAENFDDIKNAIVGFAKAGGMFLKIIVKTLNALWFVVKKVVDALGGFELVAKVLAIGLAFLLNGLLLASIWALVPAVMALAAPMLEVLLPAIAVGAAITLLILLVEDLYTSLTGGEGYFADLYNYLVGKWATLKPVLLSPFVGLWEGIKATGVMFKAAFDGMMIIVDLFIGALQSVWGWLSKIAGTLGGGLLNGINFIVDKTQSILGGGTVGASAGASNQIAGGGVNQQVENTFNIVPPSSLNSSQATDAVRGGVSDGLDRMLRQTNGAFAGGAR